MTSNDLTGLIITSILGLIIIVMAVILLSGKGAIFIAGYNTMSKSEKKKYNTIGLCKFMGKILLPIGILTPSIAIGGIYEIKWIGGVYTLIASLLIIFAVIYCNTGNRFRK